MSFNRISFAIIRQKENIKESIWVGGICSSNFDFINNMNGPGRGLTCSL